MTRRTNAAEPEASVAVWVGLAEAIAPLGQDALLRLRSVLESVGVSDSLRRALGRATQGRTDPVGVMLADLAALAVSTPDDNDGQALLAAALQAVQTSDPATALADLERHVGPRIAYAAPPPADELRGAETVTGGGAGAGAGARPAYPRIDVEGGTARAGVVIADEPFPVVVGLAPRRSSTLAGPGVIDAEAVTVEMVIVHDPATLTVEGSTRHSLNITAAQRYPTVTITVTAPWIDGGPTVRRLGVHYLVDGRIVALAWRSIVVADEAADVERAPEPPGHEERELDLSPLLDWEPPDLVISVVQSDHSDREWVWSVFSASSQIVVPDGPATAELGDDIAEFALSLRRSLQFSAGPVNAYFDLAGRGRLIGKAMPAAVQSALRAVIAAAGGSAPTVLLMTEELTVPWELAVFEPELVSSPGGESPFLGAHVAMSRWPLGAGSLANPPSQVEVHQGAVVTADYSGVAGFPVLDSAVAEGDAIAALFAAQRVTPEYLTVLDLLRGSPVADVIHVALHGRFDASGIEGGIVLVARSDTGARASILTPNAASSGELTQRPFIFLNACQVGADLSVLGSYSGFASTLLGIGAGGVIAPLWNVDDVIADQLARHFYAATWEAPTPVSAAEALRSQRASYTEAAVRAGDTTVSPTTVAYQAFGHPRLRLIRPATT